MTIQRALFRLLTLLILGLILTSADLKTVAAAVRSEATDTGENLRKLPLTTSQFTGDFDEMLQRRGIRVVVPYSRTFYHVDKGHERGLTATALRDFELYLNQKYKKQLKRRPVTVYIIPVTRDRLLEAVTTGRADIAVANLTITESRLKEVDFVEALSGGINEIVVTGPQAPQLASIDDLSGQTVHVRPASSYHESLLMLNERFVKSGKAPVKLVLLPDALEDEDILEMLNAGMFTIAVMDNWKAHVWAQLLPNIKLQQQLVLRADSHIGWAVRKNSSGLQREIEAFVKIANRQRPPVYRYKQLMKKVKGLNNNAVDKELKKFEQTLAVFQTYGKKYRFDPLLLAAQGYQESRLDQNARSRVGAIGIMQLMPRTGAELRVGNIRLAEPNIHAGAKYLDLLLQRYFSDAVFTDLDRALFAFAAYNAGPGNIARMRREAAKRGLDPNVWLNNVEIVTAERIGSETTTYVRNVFKYYAAYKLVTERQKEQEEAREKLKSAQ